MIIVKLHCGDAINLLRHTIYEQAEWIASVTFIEMNAAGKAVLSLITPMLLITDSGDITVEGCDPANPFEIEHEGNKQRHTAPEVHISAIPSRVYPKGKAIRLLSDSDDVFCLADDRPCGSYYGRENIVRLRGFNKLSDDLIHLKFAHLANNVDLVQ